MEAGAFIPTPKDLPMLAALAMTGVYVFALAVFLNEFLLYRYDHGTESEESEESDESEE